MKMEAFFVPYIIRIYETHFIFVCTIFVFLKC